MSMDGSNGTGGNEKVLVTHFSPLLHPHCLVQGERCAIAIHLLSLSELGSVTTAEALWVMQQDHPDNVLYVYGWLILEVIPHFALV